MTEMRASRAVTFWLFLCAGMVFVMAVIGAITRLTESGLSMVEWRPYIGILPPLSEAEWERVFSLYQSTPEYMLKNFYMDLAGFKEIFFWEWLHRLWGQVIGLAYLVPWIVLSLQKKIPQRLHAMLAVLFCLGATQGVMGWYMVKSGLIDRPDVSHYRLAAHLVLAFSLFAGLLWAALESKRTVALVQGNIRHRRIPWMLVVVCAVFLILTIVWGAFTAGLDAGFEYNTFPLMDGEWIPSEISTLSPFWAYVTEHRAFVQFIHRYLAIGTGGFLLILSFVTWHRFPLREVRVKFLGLTLVVMGQIGLGISTLLWVVPIGLATAHQAGAFAVVGMFVASVWSLRYETVLSS